MMGNKERCDAHNLTEIKIIADHLSDFTRDNRMLLIALMAVPIGGASPLFGVSPHPLLNAEGLVICLIVGVVAGLASALLGSVIFSMPLEKSVFTDLGSGSNGRVIERANLPNVRS